ncbi:MAG: hypothetical protein KKG76_01875 [Euryarchaeota archaeon]|nr:hypothetical protein [Euryarchaeota archaeon]
MEEKEIDGHYSLREQFLKDLNKELKAEFYKKDEHELRKKLKRRLEKGDLF